MTDDFRRFRCWEGPIVQRTVFDDIGALGLDADAVFLAAHTPVTVVRESGIGLGEGGERAILKALTGSFGQADVNTVIALTGPPGAGKSHVIRWIRAHLDASPHRRVIYVPRDLSTLRELIGRILDEMPGDKAKQAKRHLDEAVGQKSHAQLVTALLNNLNEVLAHELADQTAGDPASRRFLLGEREGSQDRRRNGLGDLLHNLRLIEHLSRVDGAAASIVNSLKGIREGRDEEIPQFTRDDLPTRAVGVRTTLDRALLPLWTSICRDPTSAIDVMNEALRRAAPMTLGLGLGVTLDDAFREAREVLRQSDTELVLLFEDLALFGLIDQDLFNQFILQPGDRYCPLRVVFAITTGRFDLTVPEGVQSRLASKYVIDNLEYGSEAASENTRQFIGRYLNVARVGRGSLIESRTATDDRGWVPNACLTREQGLPCRNKDHCFRDFGTVELSELGPVGLYPYNDTALRRALRALGSSVSPRQIVKGIVHDLLVDADVEIRNGEFPSINVRQHFDFTTERGKEAIIPDSERLSEDERERLHRARVIWADGYKEPASVTVAFDLPVLAVNAASTTPAPSGATSRERGPVRQADVYKSIYDWENGIQLPDRDMEDFRTLLHRWVSNRINLSRWLIHSSSGKGQAVLAALFPQVSIVLLNAPGAKPGADRIRVDIKADRRGVDLLLAARWFNAHGHWDPADDGRQFDFPAGLEPARLHVELEDWLTKTARLVTNRYLSMCNQGGLTPAAAAAALRGLALAALGQLQDPATSPLETVARAGSPTISRRWSTEWAPIAEAASSALEGIGGQMIAEFASARQGESGEPIVIDALTVEPALATARTHPDKLVAALKQFPEALSELEKARRELTLDWTSAAQQEAADIQATTDSIADNFGGTAAATAVQAAAEIGAQANGARVFRPIDGYREFLRAIEALEQVPDERLAAWTAFAASSGEDAVSQVFAAQAWSAHAVAYRDALTYVLVSVTKTADDLNSRVARRSGADLDGERAKTAALATELKQLLTALSEGRQ